MSGFIFFFCQWIRSLEANYTFDFNLVSLQHTYMYNEVIKIQICLFIKYLLMPLIRIRYVKRFIFVARLYRAVSRRRTAQLNFPGQRVSYDVFLDFIFSRYDTPGGGNVDIWKMPILLNLKFFPGTASRVYRKISLIFLNIDIFSSRYFI